MTNGDDDESRVVGASEDGGTESILCNLRTAADRDAGILTRVSQVSRCAPLTVVAQQSERHFHLPAIADYGIEIQPECRKHGLGDRA